MDNLEILVQALNKANLKGAFTLEESRLIANILLEMQEAKSTIKTGESDE